MSLTRTVPLVVPSLFHNGEAPVVPSKAVKKSVPLTFKKLGYEPPPPGLMSLIRTVPEAVPSLFHSSEPCVPSLAAKNKVPFTSVRLPGFEPAPPGLMSLTRTVPAAVPSDRSIRPSSGSRRKGGRWGRRTGAHRVLGRGPDCHDRHNRIKRFIVIPPRQGLVSDQCSE